MFRIVLLDNEALHVRGHRVGSHKHRVPFSAKLDNVCVSGMVLHDPIGRHRQLFPAQQAGDLRVNVVLISRRRAAQRQVNTLAEQAFSIATLRPLQVPLVVC